MAGFSIFAPCTAPHTLPVGWVVCLDPAGGRTVQALGASGPAALRGDGALRRAGDRRGGVVAGTGEIVASSSPPTFAFALL